MDIETMDKLLFATELRNPQGYSASRERYAIEIAFKAGQEGKQVIAAREIRIFTAKEAREYEK